MPKHVTEVMAEFAAGLRFEDLPPAVVHQAKRHLIDTFGCALAGAGTEPAAVARKIAESVPLKDGPAIWGTKHRALPELAAFANATATRALDFNDTYLSKEPAHPSDNTGAVLAAAESAGADGKAFLAALVVAYEVQCRLCDGASLRAKGFDHVTYGLFSTAAAAGKLLGLPASQMAHAISIAGVSGVALRQTRAGELSMWKASAFAQASRNGLFAARLARAGMTGPEKLFEGAFGFCRLVSGPFDAEKLFSKDGEYRLLRVGLKKYPAEYHGQSAVEAGLALHRHLSGTDSIDSVDVETFDAAYEIIGKDPEKWHPRTRETADHSLPYLVAAALTDGALTLESFRPHRVSDARLLELMSRIRVRKRSDFTHAYPESLPTAVTVKTKRGERFREEVSDPKGYFTNPMSDSEIEEKFKLLTEGALPKARIKALIDRVWNLEKVKHVSELTRVLG